MSLVADSPLHSSSSSGGDDFAASLETLLDSASCENSPDDDHADVEEEEEEDSLERRTKRRRVEVTQVLEKQESMIIERTRENIGSSSKPASDDICPPHPGSYKGLCTRCGQLVEDDTSRVKLGYVHEDFTLSSSEIEKLRKSNLKDLLRDKKLILILDLDHTLLNSAELREVSAKVPYLLELADSTKDDPNRSIFKLDRISMLTKLRPFVHTFLQEVSSMFELYVYTMAEKAYAHEMVKLLDPEGVYFNSKVISQGDCTVPLQKGLDVVLGDERLVLILDDTEAVWTRHAENLITMERYYFFPQRGSNAKSLSESGEDERESEGALATILKVLKRAHQMFFDQDHDAKFSSKDVRQVLKMIRREILQGCKIVFSRVMKLDTKASDHPTWKMAQKLGAVCSNDLDSSVTHVVSLDKGTHKSHWARQNRRFLVHPRWVEAAYYLWRRPKEDGELFQVENTVNNIQK
ncbi:RNA polymerase II C-terminal domain phosphatase-like 4 [Iris pallida]|uniref:RNA polymerase II C-terminal domain phosphatase-like n=1 Tax=Iris pallida TaxID=29817 RepID=A0AAX6IC61_IRIPA|nr:RNA polymerase II C-terminal domain phosphatase-like 4 [Iris pallida]